MLNLARAAQGVGGAIMFATSLALIAAAFTGKERGTAFGIYGAVLGGAVAVGPLVGGAITSGIGWRWIFFVNVPIGVVAIADHPGQDPGVPRTPTIDGSTGSASSRSPRPCSCWCSRLVRGNDDGWGSPLIVGCWSGRWPC